MVRVPWNKVLCYERQGPGLMNIKDQKDFGKENIPHENFKLILYRHFINDLHPSMQIESIIGMKSKELQERRLRLAGSLNIV